MIRKAQRMRNAPKLPCLACSILMLAMLAFAPSLSAQPSVELSELRETTNALYRAGDYAFRKAKA